jgi:hypothetical protein
MTGTAVPLPVDPETVASLTLTVTLACSGLMVAALLVRLVYPESPEPELVTETLCVWSPVDV